MPMKSSGSDKKQYILIGLVLVFIFLFMDLNNRLSELFRLTEQRDKAAGEVLSLHRTEQALYTQVAYATSEPAVKDWAYGSGHKALPGDKMLGPLPDEGYTPPAPTEIAPTIQPVENWEIWKALFIGE